MPMFFRCLEKVIRELLLIDLAICIIKFEVSFMVSVIIPVYNSEAYIDNCLESILNQTYEDFEVLLMVGICSDDSLNKCIEWQRRDNRIIIVSRKDNSLGDARNYAMNLARGEFIAYVDADDRIDENFLMDMVTPLEKNDELDFSCCGYYVSYSDGTKIEKVPKKSGSCKVDFDAYLALDIYVTVWCKVYRKKFLSDNDITMFNGLCEDVSFSYMIASVVQNVYVNRKAIYYYTVDNMGSLFNARRYEAGMDYISSMIFAISFMKKKNVYEKNRDTMKVKTCSALQTYLYHYNFDFQMVSKYKRFINDYFPEMMSFMVWKNRTIKKGNYIMFGSGIDAKRIIKQKPLDIDISYIVDSNDKVIGNRIDDIEIFGKEKLLSENCQCPVIISSRKYRFEIAKILNDLGFYNLWYIEDVLTKEQLCKEV